MTGAGSGAGSAESSGARWVSYDTASGTGSAAASAAGSACAGSTTGSGSAAGMTGGIPGTTGTNTISSRSVRGRSTLGGDLNVLVSKMPGGRVMKPSSSVSAISASRFGAPWRPRRE